MFISYIVAVPQSPGGGGGRGVGGRASPKYFPKQTYNNFK